MKTEQIVDNLQSIREQIAQLQEQEKMYADSLKKQGLGLYEGSISDCSVTEVHTSRVNVDKLIKKLDIAKHVFERFYMIESTQIRAKIVNKRINLKKAA